jgi:hypothetical protein
MTVMTTAIKVQNIPKKPVFDKVPNPIKINTKPTKKPITDCDLDGFTLILLIIYH